MAEEDIVEIIGLACACGAKDFSSFSLIRLVLGEITRYDIANAARNMNERPLLA